MKLKYLPIKFHKGTFLNHYFSLPRALNYCNWTRTQNHLVLKRTLSHLAKLLKLLKLTLIKPSRCFGIAKKATTLQMHHMYSTLKRRGKDV